MSGKGIWSAVALLLSALSGTAPAAAHEFEITDTLMVLRADGTFQVDLRVDVDALALGVSPATDDAELVADIDAMGSGERDQALARARDTIARRVRVRFDDEPVEFAVSFPFAYGSDPAGASDSTAPTASATVELDGAVEIPTRFGTVARLAGRRPAEAETVSFSASRAFGPVQLVVLDEKFATGTRMLLTGGERSAPWRLDEPPAARARERQPGTVPRYIALGFEHILPLGIDHILFVLGLFLLAAAWKPLLWQVSAFTIAHTVTLALSIAGVVSLPSRPVETLIAASIAYVAIENLATDKMQPWRPVLVFAFGLLHGLGFASVLRDLGLPDGEWVSALVSFNVGVELGQLCVIALAFLAVGWFRDRPWYRPWIVRPASAAIALIGIYWAVTRGLGA